MNEATELKARIYNVIPAATYQMHKLLSLLDIVADRTVPTACIEAVDRPRLLLNPDFVALHCRRDEHLFLLVMHELYHVILGHTRLFPRLSTQHNIAFDAVINAMLCRQFPGPEFTEFFTGINDWASFPARLLRPPPGWSPKQPIRWGRPIPPLVQRRVIKRLYGNDRQDATYHEIFEAMAGDGTVSRSFGPAGACESEARDGETGDGKVGRLFKPCDAGDFVLIGDHGADGRERRALADPAVTETVREIVAHWPPPPFHIAGRDAGRPATNFCFQPGAARQAFRRALDRFLRSTGITGDAPASPERRKTANAPIEAETVIPNLRDRRAVAMTRVWGHPPLLYRTPLTTRRPVRVPEPSTFLYLDISGSMGADLPAVAAALKRPHRQGRCRIFVFSTVVDEVPPHQLQAASVKNTFGTDINCVFDHLFSLPPRKRPRRIAILTDGYVGGARDEHVRRLREGHIRTHVALVGRNDGKDMAGYAHRMVQLPDTTEDRT